MNQRVLNYFMTCPESLLGYYKSTFSLHLILDKSKAADFTEITSYKGWIQVLELKLTLTASNAFKAPFNESI